MNRRFIPDGSVRILGNGSIWTERNYWSPSYFSGEWILHNEKGQKEDGDKRLISKPYLFIGLLDKNGKEIYDGHHCDIERSIRLVTECLACTDNF